MGVFYSMVSSVKSIRLLNRECRLYFLGTSLNGISQGIFTIVFNLYLLKMGISPDVLGAILGAGPFAQALGSIPMGFLMEIIGYKKTLLFVYGISGLARILQVATPFVPLMAISAFASGLALAGDFVMRLPFLACNSTPEQNTTIFSLSSIFFKISLAIGALIGGFIPNLFQWMGMNATGAYQLLLLLAGFLSLICIIPISMLKATPPIESSHKISLKPYLWGMDRFTVQQAVISLFVGFSLGLTNPFMNIYFLYHLGASREIFGLISAVAIIPILIITLVGPNFAKRVGSVRSVTILRFVIPIFTIILALTKSIWAGMISYWVINAVSTASQPLSFAFAMYAARISSKAATSAWLNVTFWLGMAIAAPIAGIYLNNADYITPLFISAFSILLAGLLNEIFFKRKESLILKKEQESRDYIVNSS